MQDWHEWMRAFSLELLRESPSPALRCCSALAERLQQLSLELFNAAFYSCWEELSQARCRRDAAGVQPRCSRDAAEIWAAF